MVIYYIIMDEIRVYFTYVKNIERSINLNNRIYLTFWKNKPPSDPLPDKGPYR